MVKLRPQLPNVSPSRNVPSQFWFCRPLLRTFSHYGEFGIVAGLAETLVCQESASLPKLFKVNVEIGTPEKGCLNSDNLIAFWLTS